MSERKSTRSRGPYHLGLEIFPTKEALRSRIQGILKKNRPIEQDHSLLMDLILWHPDAMEKIGCGISYFETRQNTVFPDSRTFWIIRLDGSEIDFSYKSCLSPPTPWQNFVACARLAVDDQIWSYRQARILKSPDGMLYCPVMDKWFHFSEMEVDHKHPVTFTHLINAFVLSRSIDVAKVKYVDAPSGTGSLFSDTELRTDWAEYHKHFAELWLISKEGHKLLTKQRRAM